MVYESDVDDSKWDKKEPNFFVRIFWDFVQTLTWMWHDIKPRKKVHVYGEMHDRRGFFGRIWDGLRQTFRWMGHDLKHYEMTDGISMKEWVRHESLGTLDFMQKDFKVIMNRETTSKMMALMLIILIAVRIVVVWATSSRPGADPYYMFRHGIFTVVWGLLLYFFYNVYLLKKTVSPLTQNLRDMERASFLAFLACMIKFATSAYFIFFTRMAHLALNSVTVYYVGELLIWLILSMYMFGHWRRYRKIRILSQKDDNNR